MSEATGIAPGAARELLPLITKLRSDTEAKRRIAEPIVECLRETRLCRMAIVRELQGLELATIDTLDVFEALAGAEASVAWIVWNNYLPGLFSRYLDASARAELFGNPAWLYASSTRPTGKAVVQGDGFRVSGRWSLVSGCELAEWIALACVVEESGAPRMTHGMPEVRIQFFRRRDVDILDTWKSGGLRGTGSHDIVVKDKYVPTRWSISPADTVQLDAPIARVPMISTMAAGFAAQTLGMAARAIDTLVELTRTKVTVDPGPGLTERPAFLASIVRHSAAIEAARGYLRARVATLWDAAASGKSPGSEAVAELWGAAHHAVDAARQTIDAMYAAGGTSSLYTDCPLERVHRDLHAMLRHVVIQTFWLEDAGRTRFGIAPVHPLYAV